MMPGMARDLLSPDPGPTFVEPPDSDLEDDNRGPVFVIDSTVHTSCVNAECTPWLEAVGHSAQRTLELADLPRGESWAILRFKTGLYTSGSMYVRKSAASHFPENVLSMHTLIIRGAIFNTFSIPPRMRLAGKVFPLFWNMGAEARAVMRPAQRLSLFMPLMSVPLRLPHPGMASFAPVGEGVP